MIIDGGNGVDVVDVDADTGYQVAPQVLRTSTEDEDQRPRCSRIRMKDNGSRIEIKSYTSRLLNIFLDYWRALNVREDCLRERLRGELRYKASVAAEATQSHGRSHRSSRSEHYCPGIHM